jgi:hypothetical protein
MKRSPRRTARQFSQDFQAIAGLTQAVREHSGHSQRFGGSVVPLMPETVFAGPPMPDGIEPGRFGPAPTAPRWPDAVTDVDEFGTTTRVAPPLRLPSKALPVLPAPPPGDCNAGRLKGSPA